MTLRISTREQLGAVSDKVRRQLEPLLPSGEASPAAAPVPTAPDLERMPGAHLERRYRRKNRPEQAAGRRLIMWADETPMPVRLVPPALYEALGRDPRREPVMVGELLVHTPNGGGRGTGKEAAILQGQGVRKGWPDYTLYVPVPPHPGLVLELKAEDGGKPDADQLALLSLLEAYGWRACVAWGSEQAIGHVRAYLELGA